MLGLPMTVVMGAGILVVVILMLMTVLARMYRKAGPHEALIVYGMGGTRVHTGEARWCSRWCTPVRIFRWS